MEWNSKTKKTTILMDNQEWANVKDIPEDAVFKGLSPDKKMILFAYDISSTAAKYMAIKVDDGKSFEIHSKDGSDSLRYCNWVKNKDNISSVVYVINNNIHWKQGVNWDDHDLTDMRITSDGEDGKVYNGIADWMYKERVLGVDLAHYMNDVGDMLAFAQFNDTMVNDFRYPFYGDVSIFYCLLFQTIFTDRMILATQTQNSTL